MTVVGAESEAHGDAREWKQVFPMKSLEQFVRSQLLGSKFSTTGEIVFLRKTRRFERLVIERNGK